MENRMKKVGKVSSFLTKYIGVIIICFSVIAFFWRDGFAWTTSYTSVFLGVAMFGMGLTIKMDDFKRVFSRPKEILIGFVAQSLFWTEGCAAACNHPQDGAGFEF